MLENGLGFPALVLVKLQGWPNCQEAISSLGGKERASVSECVSCREMAGGAKRALGGAKGCSILLEKRVSC